jgi:hypothetical protein
MDRREFLIAAAAAATAKAGQTTPTSSTSAGRGARAYAADVLEPLIGIDQVFLARGTFGVGGDDIRP